jgi:tryptophanase
MVKIAHIINPVIVPETSDLFTAQPVTFSTMKTAQELAVQQGLDVTLVASRTVSRR